MLQKKRARALAQRRRGEETKKNDFVRESLVARCLVAYTSNNNTRRHTYFDAQLFYAPRNETLSPPKVWSSLAPFNQLYFCTYARTATKYSAAITTTTTRVTPSFFLGLVPRRMAGIYTNNDLKKKQAHVAHTIVVSSFTSTIKKVNDAHSS